MFPEGIQVVGDRIYYSFEIQQPTTGALAAWVGSTTLDGSGWKAEQIAPGLSGPGVNLGFGYKSFVTVGGKTFYSIGAAKALVNPKSTDPSPDSHIFLGTSGSNIISKGDSFGIGLSQDSQVRAFINVGEDYLYRGEAPLDTGGATSVGTLPDESLHQVAAVYDGRVLKLYVDGSLVSETGYKSPPAKNDFPLLLGDGLVGSLKDVRIFNRAIDPKSIKGL
jgi:hypothetical protein